MSPSDKGKNNFQNLNFLCKNLTWKRCRLEHCRNHWLRLRMAAFTFSLFLQLLTFSWFCVGTNLVHWNLFWIIVSPDQKLKCVGTTCTLCKEFCSNGIKTTVLRLMCDYRVSATRFCNFFLGCLALCSMPDLLFVWRVEEAQHIHTVL